GLGSSAAVAAATVRALMAYYTHRLSHQKIMSLIDIAEKYAHGNPSGIDSAAVVAGDPIWFQKGHGVKPLMQSHPISIVIADSGDKNDTRSSVLAVQHLLQSQPQKGHNILERLGEFTMEARESIAYGNFEKLGCLFNEAQSKLKALGVS